MFISKQCIQCIHNCQMNQEGCQNFEHKVTKEELKEINAEVLRQNVNLHRLARNKHLNYKLLIRMLRGRMDFTYKYLSVLNFRLNEKDEWLKYIDRFENGEMKDIV